MLYFFLILSVVVAIVIAISRTISKRFNAQKIKSLQLIDNLKTLRDLLCHETFSTDENVKKAIESRFLYVARQKILESTEIKELLSIRDFIYDSLKNTQVEQEMALIKDSTNKIILRELPDSEDIFHLSQLSHKVEDEKIKVIVVDKIVELIEQEDDLDKLSALLDDYEFRYNYSTNTLLVKKIKEKLTSLNTRDIAGLIKGSKKKYSEILTEQLLEILSDCQDKDMLLDIYRKTGLDQIKDKYLSRIISCEITNLILNNHSSDENNNIIEWLVENKIDLKVTMN